MPPHLLGTAFSLGFLPHLSSLLSRMWCNDLHFSQPVTLDSWWPFSPLFTNLLNIKFLSDFILCGCIAPGSQRFLQGCKGFADSQCIPLVVSNWPSDIISNRLWVTILTGSESNRLKCQPHIECFVLVWFTTISASCGLSLRCWWFPMIYL